MKSEIGMIQNIVVLGILLWCSITDLIKKRIYVFPLFLSVGIAAIIQCVGECSFTGIRTMLLGAIPGIVCLIVAWITHEEVGYGDGFLIGGCGVLLGIQRCMQMVITGFFFSGIWGIILLLRKKGRKERFPFVPFLMMGFLYQWIVGV